MQKMLDKIKQQEFEKKKSIAEKVITILEVIIERKTVYTKPKVVFGYILGSLLLAS